MNEIVHKISTPFCYYRALISPPLPLFGCVIKSISPSGHPVWQDIRCNGDLSLKAACLY